MKAFFFSFVVAYVLCFSSARGEVVTFLPQGFFFDYVPANETVPIPITQQCETIHISWNRGLATGPNPVAPYSLQVYTSTSIVPFVIPIPDPNALTFDWAVPFGPGTQYQICMFDSKGTSGGCQRMTTVIPNLSEANVTCQNVTYPSGPLNVSATADQGAWSQSGWPDQCTDITITPLTGTPPFTLTVAPSLHPPYNITSLTMDPIVWTVSLGWGLPFFVSLKSSDGQVWANGPLHAGGNGPTDCLAPGTVSASKARATAVGAGVGALFAGIILTAIVLAAWSFFRSRKGNAPINPFVEKRATSLHNFESEPVYLPDRRRSVSEEATVTSPTSSTPSRTYSRRFPRVPVPTLPQNSSQVYVVHNDAGRAPVTVYTGTGTEVIELPPGYIDTSSSTSPQDDLSSSKPRRRTDTF